MNIDTQRFIEIWPDRTQGWYALTGTGVQITELCPTQRFDRPRTIGRAVHGFVVEDYGVSIAREAEIEFDAVGAELSCSAGSDAELLFCDGPDLGKSLLQAWNFMAIMLI